MRDDCGYRQQYTAGRQLRPSTGALMVVRTKKRRRWASVRERRLGSSYYLSDSPPGRTTGCPGLTAGAYGFGGNCCCCGCWGKAPGRGDVIG